MKKSLTTVVLGLSLLACGSKDDAKSTKTTEAPKKEDEAKKPEAPKKPDKPEPPKSIPVKIDPEIAKRVKEIVANCEIDEKDHRISGCKGNEEYAIKTYAQQNEVVGVYESLGEIALTEGEKDKKVFTAVVATWNLMAREPQLKASTPAAAERVLKLYALVPDTVDRFGYAAAIPVAAGKRAELVAALGKLKPTSPLRQSSLKYLLPYGGAAALPDVQAIYKAATDDDTRYSTAFSVGMATLQPIPDEDRTKLCDWVKTIAADPATSERGLSGALDSLSRCKGTYIDDGLAAIDARLASGKLTDVTANALHHMCWAEGMIGSPPNGSAAQCERVVATLTKAITTQLDTAPAGAMTSAIYGLGYVAKNAKLGAKVKPTLTALVTSKHKHVAEAAKMAVKDL